MRYLTVLEVSQKQNYIYKTERLAENIGASMIIREITEDLPERILGNHMNIISGGGGNCLLDFLSKKEAYDFSKAFSTKVLTDYPGVELFLASVEYDEEKDRIMEKIDELYEKLGAKKADRDGYFQIYSPGITELCNDTQYPAAGKDSRGKFVSAECLAKLFRDNPANVPAREQKMFSDWEFHTDQFDFFKEMLPDSDKYRFANEFEELGGTKNVKDYMAVIFIDGNKMGKKLEAFKNKFNSATKDETPKDANALYKKKYGALSEALDDSYRAAVKEAIGKITGMLPEFYEKGSLSQNTDKDSKKTILPIRPLVLSGDDICIVCDARISINLAEEILKAIDHRSVDVGEGEKMALHACAGIAMVKSHYPFFRAHELAEELCDNAKARFSSKDDEDESALDFLIVQGEIEGSLAEIRRNKYLNSTLTNKPFALNKDGTEDKGRKDSLEYYTKRFKKLKGMSRGMLKEYREALYKGPEAAEAYITHHQLSGMLDGSFDNGHCIDFDIIEMLDIYNPVSDTEGKEKA